MKVGAGGIEDDGFATGAEAGVDSEEAFLTQRGGEEELAQIIGEDLDGGSIGEFLRGETHFCFHRWHKQSLAGIFGGRGHMLCCCSASCDEMG